MRKSKTLITRKVALRFQKEHQDSSVSQIYEAAPDIGISKCVAYAIVRGTAKMVQPLPTGRRKEYHGYYVYADGRVYSPNYGKFLKHRYVGDYGHYGYALKINGETKELLAHQLVLRLFVGPPPTAQHECRHLNGDPTDNKVVNLAWGTRQENADDRVLHNTNTCGSRSGMAKLTEKEVVRIKRRWLKVKDTRTYFNFSVEAADKFDVSHGTIDAILRGKTWNHVNI